MKIECKINWKEDKYVSFFKQNLPKMTSQKKILGYKVVWVNSWNIQKSLNHKLYTFLRAKKNRKN